MKEHITNMLEVRRDTFLRNKTEWYSIVIALS